eukprot:scaffold970_cov412-Prasinococcus_capsulatus_cf.AAC.12
MSGGSTPQAHLWLPLDVSLGKDAVVEALESFLRSGATVGDATLGFNALSEAGRLHKEEDGQQSNQR